MSAWLPSSRATRLCRELISATTLTNQPGWRTARGHDWPQASGHSHRSTRPHVATVAGQSSLPTPPYESTTHGDDRTVATAVRDARGRSGFVVVPVTLCSQPPHARRSRTRAASLPDARPTAPCARRGQCPVRAPSARCSSADRSRSTRLSAGPAVFCAWPAEGEKRQESRCSARRDCTKPDWRTRGRGAAENRRTPAYCRRLATERLGTRLLELHNRYSP